MSLDNIKSLESFKNFKDLNKNQWINNSSFWLSGRMGHIQDVSPTALRLIKEIISSEKLTNPHIYDIGCGEGWLLRKLLKENMRFKYTGTDFNPIFISELNKEFAKNRAAKFLLNDIEENPPSQLAVADIIVNAFNFFELPNLEAGFLNTKLTLKKNGYLVIITIDPVMQLLAVSESYKEFIQCLNLYSKYSSKIGYVKKIVADNLVTDKYYMGILYSIFDYLELAKKNGFTLYDSFEINCPNPPIPQIFQFLVLKYDK
jgi:SAM-dependent methyltransferase